MERTVKAVRERCTILIAGSWNQEIFVPSWVRSVLGLDSQPTLNMILGNGVTFRLEWDETLLDVTPHQVLLSPAGFSDESFVAVEASAIRILKRLSETPIRGLGVNFGFDITEPPKTFDELFNLSDDGLISAVGAVVGFTTIARKLRVDNRLLNLTARRDGAPGGPCKLDFNYHHDAKSAGDAIENLENHVLTLKANALEFAEKLYGLRAEAT
ncbi:MAG: hypothetical protein IPK82_07615 [Polyangiaceae bacterium]|nr:hypothetical protein [Polyangiaceae bacterium]